MITGYSSADTAIESLNLEAEAYLTKPIDAVDLFEMVERAARRREKKQYEESLAAVHDHAIGLTSINTLKGVAELTVDTIETVFGFNRISFMIVNENRLIRIDGVPEETRRFLPLNGPGVTVRTAKTGLTQLVSDVRLDKDFVPGRHVDSLSESLSELAVPVKASGEVVAVINVESPEENFFDETDRRLMELLAESVSSAIERLRRVEALERMVEERTSDLRKAYEELKALDKVKDQFIGMAAHELRTPLTSIKGYIDFIMGGSVGEIPENMLGLLNVVQRNTRRLESLTNDLLDQQQLECGKMDVVFESFPVSDMLEHIVDEFSPIVERKDQVLTVVDNVETGLISADKNRLSQVLCNLLSNASKFSSENSDIFLIVDEEESHLQFSVKDEGFGLSPEDIEKLFKPFPEIDRPTVTEKSTGLGLSICKGIVNLHGGEIWAESGGRGMGSKFVFTIPKVPRAAEDREVLEEEVKAVIE
jgi:signal transduction histidine kinase